MRRAFLPAVAVAACLLTAACADQAVCRDGEYPAAQVDSTGRTCVPDGQEPPAGYVRYPPGQEPQRTDDKWDQYWRRHTIDKSGAVVPAT
ncbi:SCO0607 family lipoprotein [Actinoplanes sp. NPDC000266]